MRVKPNKSIYLDHSLNVLSSNVVLANNGIYRVNKYHQMDESDQTIIQEVMEQQGWYCEEV